MERSAALKRAYPWLILVSCCLLQGAGLGIISNCAGLFFVPVMQDYGCSMSGISLYVTFNNVFQCIGTIFVTRIIRRYRVKYLIPFAGLVVGLAQISLYFSHSLFHWYACGVIQGFFIIFISGIIIPLSISNWFTERTGFALGMTAMSAGLVGALMSAILGALITSYSWRVAALVAGLVIILLTVPSSWFFMALDPKEKGCVPFGGAREATITESSGQGRIRFDIRVVAIVIIASTASFSAIFNNHLPALGEFTGVVLVAPAILLSINMFGNMGFKIGFGALNDYIGAKRTTIISYVIIAGSSLMLLAGNDYLTCAASFLFGVNALIATAQGHLLAKDVWTKNEYPMALQIVHISVRLSYAIFAFVEGALFDMWGSYTPLILLQVAAAAIGIMFVFILFSCRGKRNKKISALLWG